MGTTKIEWADKVFNPVTGCTPVSEGCANCYARRMAKRIAGRYGYPADDPFRVAFHPERLAEPFRLKKPRRIFVSSMGDLFHEDVRTEWIDAVLDVVEACPQHMFMALSKRPENIQEKLYAVTGDHPLRELGGGDYLPNLWLGVTAENQARADERIPILLQSTAAVRFVSVEPVLGHVDLSPYFGICDGCGSSEYRCGLAPLTGHIKCCPDCSHKHGLSWVIVGAETGPGARPMDPAWARSLRDQCKEARVPFFFKRTSGKAPIPEDLMVREWPEGRHAL